MFRYYNIDRFDFWKLVMEPVMRNGINFIQVYITHHCPK